MGQLTRREEVGDASRAGRPGPATRQLHAIRVNRKMKCRARARARASVPLYRRRRRGERSAVNQPTRATTASEEESVEARGRS